MPAWRFPSLSPKLAALAVGWMLASPCLAEDLYREARTLRSNFAGEVEKLAAACDAQDLKSEAKKTREVLGRQDPYSFTFRSCRSTWGRRRSPTTRRPP